MSSPECLHPSQQVIDMMPQPIQDLNNILSQADHIISVGALVATFLAVFVALYTSNQANKLAARAYQIDLSGEIFWAQEVEGSEAAGSALFDRNVSRPDSLVIHVTNGGIRDAILNKFACKVEIPPHRGRISIDPVLFPATNRIRLAAGDSVSFVLLNRTHIRGLMDRNYSIWPDFLRILTMSFHITDETRISHRLRFSFADRRETLRIATTPLN